MDRKRLSRLSDILVELPGDALLPVSWLRARLDVEPGSDLQVHQHEADLSSAEFADLVRRSAVQVRVWCSAGDVPGAYRLPGKKRPGAWRIPATAVDAFRERKPVPTVAPGALPDTTDISVPNAIDIGAWRAVRGRRRA